MDAQGIKDLDEILDSQGGFTQQAADRHLKEFGGYTDQDALLEHGCLSCVPDFAYKKERFTKFLNQEGFGVKSMEEAGKYINVGLSQEQKEELADLFYAEIEKVFATKHRDYAEMVLVKLSPASLARDKDLEAYQAILERIGDSNNHFKNLVKIQINTIKLIQEQRKGM